VRGPCCLWRFELTRHVPVDIVTTTDNNVNLWALNSLNPAGQVSSETLGNGITSAHTYDPVTALLTRTARSFASLPVHVNMTLPSSRGMVASSSSASCSGCSAR